MKWAGSKKRIIVWVMVMMVLEAVIVFWPITCASWKKGLIAVWKTMEKPVLVAFFWALIVGFFMGLRVGLGHGLVVGSVAGLGLAFLANPIGGGVLGIIVGLTLGLIWGFTRKPGRRLLVPILVGLAAGTLGYGDISPLRFFPQFLVVLETVIGIALVVIYIGMILRVAERRPQTTGGGKARGTQRTDDVPPDAPI